jgi:hypothetical protein
MKLIKTILAISLSFLLVLALPEPKATPRTLKVSPEFKKPSSSLTE